MTSGSGATFSGADTPLRKASTALSDTTKVYGRTSPKSAKSSSVTEESKYLRFSQSRDNDSNERVESHVSSTSSLLEQSSGSISAHGGLHDVADGAPVAVARRGRPKKKKRDRKSSMVGNSSYGGASRSDFW